jgi:hypothetical protein
MPKERRNLIYPYQRLDGDVALAVLDPTVDGLVPEKDPLVHDYRTADFSAVAPAEWSQFAVKLEATVPTDALEALERDGKDPLVVVAADCAATNLRRSIPLVQESGGRWRGGLEVQRRQVAGQLLLRAILAARVDEGGRREIGDSPIWTLHADPPAIPIIEGNLPVQWVDFPST